MKIYYEHAILHAEKTSLFLLTLHNLLSDQFYCTFCPSTHGRICFLRSAELYCAYRRDSTGIFVVCSWGKV